jgi:polysaccharide export outer membrane protein
MAFLLAVALPAMAQDAVRAVAPQALPAVQAASASQSTVNSLSGLTSIAADYRITANDLLDIDVFGVPDLKRTVRVNSTGLVSLALVGGVSLAGLTAQEAEERIAAVYASKFLQDPQVSVFIREFTTQRVTVEGAVIRPGIYPVTGQVTLLRALALAWGVAPLADMNQVMILRSLPSGKQQTLTYNVEKIREGLSPDPEVLADDVVVVRRDSSRILFRDSIFRDVLDSFNPLSIFKN